MSDQQALAVKPLRISPASDSHDSVKSPAALKGATSAFLPRASSPTVGVSPASTGARLAAFAAGVNAQQRLRTTSPHRQDGNKEPSPPRGRQVHPRPGLASDAGRTAVSYKGSSHDPRPQLQTRSSSTLAARHAAAHSRSPQRGLSKSPLSSRSTIEQSVEREEYNNKLDALSGAVVSMTHSLAREIPTEQSAPLRTKLLDFEKIPPLANPGISQITTEITSAKHQPLKEIQDPVASKDIPSDKASSVDINNRVHDTTRLQPPRPAISRGSSTESAVTVATLTTMSDELGRALKHESSSMPSRSLSSIPLSSSRNSPHSKSKHQDDYFSSMKVNDLADAMVASSLASSRAASPPKKTPPLMPRRRSKSIPTLREETKFPVVNERLGKSHRRPPRPMKHTLRKRASSDEEVEITKRGRRHWMRKHPNMHSEGDRKRWRDKVTERERKRYEGVFAANRGLLIGPGYFEATPSALSDNSASGNNVVNVIVRDVWERSRLPREVLKEIYDLVSPEESHALNREQFVVGLWLIDQRLKGRKLPVKVSTSVWSSVRHSQGIKVKRRV